jgi:CBS domain-containing protein
MYDQSVRSVMRPRTLVEVGPEASVAEAAKLMAKKSVGAVVVVAAGQLAGIFTERDIAYRVVAKGLDANATRLSDVMTRDPETIASDQPFGRALHRMQARGFRHMPVVEGGKVVGIVSSRSAMDPALEEFVYEANRRKHYEKTR